MINKQATDEFVEAIESNPHKTAAEMTTVIRTMMGELSVADQIAPPTIYGHKEVERDPANPEYYFKVIERQVLSGAAFEIPFEAAQAPQPITKSYVTLRFRHVSAPVFRRPVNVLKHSDQDIFTIMNDNLLVKYAEAKDRMLVDLMQAALDAGTARATRATITAYTVGQHINDVPPAGQVTYYYMQNTSFPNSTPWITHAQAGGTAPAYYWVGGRKLVSALKHKFADAALPLDVFFAPTPIYHELTEWQFDNFGNMAGDIVVWGIEGHIPKSKKIWFGIPLVTTDKYISQRDSQTNEEITADIYSNRRPRDIEIMCQQTGAGVWLDMNNNAYADSPETENGYWIFGISRGAIVNAQVDDVTMMIETKIDQNQGGMAEFWLEGFPGFVIGSDMGIARAVCDSRGADL